MAVGELENRHGPAASDLDYVDMAVEMHTFPCVDALASRHDVPARILVTVARGAICPHHFCLKARGRQPPVEIFANLQIVVARRIERRNADQILRQRDQIIAPRHHGLVQPV